jgi:hypothetical protein
MEKTGSSWSIVIIADFSSRMIEHSATATAVAIRNGKASLAKEIAGAQGGRDRLLALLGQDPQLDPAFLDVKDGVCRVSLREDDLAPAQLDPSFSGPDLGQERLGFESRFFFDLHGPVPSASRSSITKSSLQMAGSNVLDMAVVSPLFDARLSASRPRTGWPADLGIGTNGWGR